MRGHLEHRGNKIWRAKVFLGKDPKTGRQRYLSRTIHGTKREAHLILAQILVDVGQGIPEVMNGTLDLVVRTSWL